MHSQIIDDQQRHRFQKLQALFACAIDRGFSQFIKQGVGLTVEHAVALLDSRLADGLSQVAFAGAGRTKKQSIFMAGNEGAGSQAIIRFLALTVTTLQA